MLNYQIGNKMKKNSLIALLVLIAGCSKRGIPNYQVTPNGYKVYQYTKIGEPSKDILSNGDTLVVVGGVMYVISKGLNNTADTIFYFKNKQ